MNVLYISYDGMTDPLGQSQVIPYLIGLTKNGHSFTILSCEKHENYQKNKDVIQNILSAAGISWQPIFYTKNPPVLSTLYDYLKLRHTAGKLHSIHDFDAAHCRSYISSLVGLWLQKKHKVPFIFDMRGFWADERVDGGLWNLSNPVFNRVYKFFKKRELEFLNRSAAIISLTKAGKNEILSWKGLDFKADKITVIPCCADTELFDPKKVSIARQKAVKQALNISDDDFIVGYLGSIGTWYLLDDMMQLFSELKMVVKNAKFLFVTQNSAAEIKDCANKYNVNPTDIIIAPASRGEVPLMISLFNYGLFFIKPSYSKISSSPTKQGEIMAMDVPVICNAGVGDTDAIIEHYNAGWVIKNNEFDKAVKQVANGFTYPKNSIRAGAIDFFSLNKGVEQYNTVYSHISKNKV